jgi:hypothetical protein
MILTPFDEYEVDTARTDAVAFGVGYLRVDAAGRVERLEPADVVILAPAGTPPGGDW